MATEGPESSEDVPSQVTASADVGAASVAGADAPAIPVAQAAGAPADAEPLAAAPVARPGSSADVVPAARARARRPCLSAREIATYGLLAAVALVFGYLETLLPAPVPVPGVKLGLGNVVIVFCLEAFGTGPAAVLMLVKVMASALLFGNPTVFAYSLAGGVVSLLAMAAAWRVRAFSTSGVSMVGGVFHMVGQMLVVAWVLTPQVALAYLPVLLVSGLASGLVVGYLARAALRVAESSSLMRARAKRMRMREGRAHDAPR